MTDIAVRKYYAASSETEIRNDIHRIITNSGWQFWDEVSATDKVYRTNGEEGIHPYIYLEVTGTSTIYFWLWLYWNNSTHTGTTRINYGNNDFAISYAGYNQFIANKDFFGFGLRDNASAILIGFCNKLFYPEITNTTSLSSLGDNVNLAVSSSSGIIKGQRIQIVGIDYEGRDQLQVTDVPDSTHVTVLNLPRDYASGAFLGVTPCPAFVANKYHYSPNFNALCPRNAVGDADVTVVVEPGMGSSTINLGYADPDYASYSCLFPSSVIFGVEDDSIIGFVDSDLVKLLGDEMYSRGRIWIKNDVGLPEQGMVSSATSNTLSDDDKSWTVNELAGKMVLLVSGTGSGQALKILSNTSDTLTLDSTWDTVPDATSIYRIGEGIYRSFIHHMFKEEDHSTSLSSSSSSSVSVSSSSGSSSSSSRSSSSESVSSSSSYSSSSSSSNSSSSSSSSISSSSSSSSLSVSSSSSSKSSSSTSSSSSSHSVASSSGTFYPAANGDDGYIKKVLTVNWNSVVVTSSAGTFTSPSVFDWAVIDASWVFTFTGTNFYEVRYNGNYEGSYYTNNAQSIFGSYDYPLAAVFASNFGGTFVAGDEITFNTTAADFTFYGTTNELRVDGHQTDLVDTWAEKSFIKFDNVTIPAGATINSAFIRLTASVTSNVDDSNTYIRRISAIPPTTGILYEHDQNRENEEYETWLLPAFTAESTYDSSDISTLIQGAIEDSGWVSGNDISIYLTNGGTVLKEFYAYDNGSKFAELHVAYSY